MKTIDRAALLAWLRDHTNHPNVVVASIYTGLAARVERGDYDQPTPPPEEE